MATYLILSIASLIISLLSVGYIRKYFSRQLLDIPNERSSHEVPTPRGGGMGFIVAFAITSAIAAILGKALFPLLPLWFVLLPLAVIGILDDRFEQRASIRYLVQLSSAIIAVACFGSFPQPWLESLGITGQIIAIVLTIIGMTALINFYNFTDGLDGLVAGCSAVEIGFLAIYLDLPIFWLLVAALFGFLWWNWSPAKIFMGDAGSTVLGATVAIALLNNNGDYISAWSALAIVLPLVADAIYTLCLRLMRRENIFQAHRSHIYQRLQRSGWSHSVVALTYISINLAIAASIACFGSIGAWGSLFAIVLAIIWAEIYLQPTPIIESNAN